jgi:hypothetical protein
MKTTSVAPINPKRKLSLIATHISLLVAAFHSFTILFTFALNANRFQNYALGLFVAITIFIFNFK